MFDVAIVGAGVAGLNCARLLAKEGYKIILIEKKKEIGKPSKCAGLVSYRILKLLKMDKDIILNKVRKGIFISKKFRFELESKKPVYVLDREKLDKFLFEEVKNFGAIAKLGEEFLDLKINKHFVWIKTSKKTYKTKILIGADGAFSKVAKVLKIERPKKILFGLQTTAKGSFNPNEVEVWFDVAPNFFGWVIPLNEEFARIGLAAIKNPNFYFKNFLKKRIGKILKPDTSGIIRPGLIKRSCCERVLVVGDAACQLKPFSGGGIIYSLISSKIAANACKEAIEKNDFNSNFFEIRYEREWRKKLEFAIIKGLIFRKIFDIFKADPIFLFIKMFGLKKALEKFDFDLLK